MESSGTLHLLIGPVGAGKTTYAQQRMARTPGVFLDLDTWMVRLFAADPRPQENVIAWYLERRDRCRDLLWDVALNVLGCGTDVLLEIGLLAAAEREAFYAKARDEGLQLAVYLLDAPRAIRRERVAQRNRSVGPFTQIVPIEFFERASDAWQPPSESERTAWGILDV
ncbi:MAG TPA: ATP-binding protein [Kofleriaceae bacterium]|nr:ATP-binding protein [Kofleriaceae bacterium]